MKVELQPAIINQKVSVESKVKRFLTTSHMKLKTLVKDVFEKKTSKDIIVARKEPNWCQAEGDMPNTAVVKSQISMEEATEDFKRFGLNINDFIIK